MRLSSMSTAKELFGRCIRASAVLGLALALFVPPMQRVDVRKVTSFSLIAIIVIWSTDVFKYIWDAGAFIGGITSELTMKLFGA